MRILQAEIDNKYSLKKILEKIKAFQCTHTTGNYYKFINYKPEIQYLNQVMSINFNLKYGTRESIKKILQY